MALTLESFERPAHVRVIRWHVILRAPGERDQRVSIRHFTPFVEIIVDPRIRMSRVYRLSDQMDAGRPVFVLSGGNKL